MRVALVAMERGWCAIGRLPAVLRAAGLEVVALCAPEAPLAQTVHVQRVIPWDRRSTRAPGARRRLWQRLGEGRPDWVVPGDDAAAHYLARLRDGAAPGGALDAVQAVLRRSLPPAEVLAGLDFKDRFAEACRELGVPAVPTTVHDLGELGGRAGGAAVGRFPAILKLPFGAGGQGVVGVRCAGELAGAVRRLRRRLWAAGPVVGRLRKGWDLPQHPAARRGRACVQPWLKGLEAQHAFLAVEGKMLGGTTWRTLQRVRPFAPSTVLESIDCPEAAAHARTLVAALGFTGFGQLEFMIEAETARVLLVEMNVRPVASHALGHHAGADLGALLAANLRGERPGPERVGRAGVRVALFPGELARDPASPHLASALHDVPWDDPPLLARLAEGRPWPAHPGAPART
jgi:hypothetical protein